MAAPETSEAMRAVAAAVSGPDTPSEAAVASKPRTDAIWALILSGPAVSFMLMSIVLFLATPNIPFLKGLFDKWPADVAEARIQALAAIAMVLAFILAVVVFRLASGGLKKVEAKAGPGSLTVESN